MASIRAPLRIGENFIAPDFGPDGFPADEDDNAFEAQPEVTAKPSFLSGVRDLRNRLKQSSHLTTTNTVVSPHYASPGNVPKNFSGDLSQSKFGTFSAI